MIAERKQEVIQEAVPLSESEALNQILAAPKDAVSIGETLPEMQRARLAQFCYNRVHMRELGLRLASTCDLMTLKAAFGRAGDVVFQQSRNVEDTLGALKNAPGNQPPKPITLKGVASD
ncbi:MAG: hypothetical protein AAF412_03780 [Pseudomonadota bacterium]